MLDINILISKFKKYGFGGLALKWLDSFCRNRRQLVKVNNHFSQIVTLNYGTAQGGVLGPIVFLIYINDLLNLQLHSRMFAYADDTALVCSAFNKDILKVKINSDLEKVSKWLINNKLLINVSKSKCILFLDSKIF